MGTGTLWRHVSSLGMNREGSKEREKKKKEEKKQRNKEEYRKTKK